MTAFQFMQNAFFLLAGVACVALAAVIVYAVTVGIYRSIYEIGQALATYFIGIGKGFEDHCGASSAGGAPDNYEVQPPTPQEKTQIEDCRACWCNTCAKIEVCNDANEDAQQAADRPYPCDGCINGMRYMPREDGGKCLCAGYKASKTENNG